jgi:hypothetical protein
MSPEKLKAYRSFLLRCWQEEEIAPGQHPAWRFSIEGVSSSLDRQGFNNLQELLTFIYNALLIPETEGRLLLASLEDDPQDLLTSDY